MKWDEYADTRCVHCDSTNTVPVWEEPRDYFMRNPPDHIGCKDCHTMRPYIDDDRDVSYRQSSV
jgi:hypothetical protein